MSSKPLQLVRWLSLVLAITGLPFVLWAVVHIRSNTTDMSQWVPDSRAEKVRYDQFVEQFGIDDFVMVTWPNCTQDDVRLFGLQERLLGNTPNDDWPVKDTPAFASVTTGEEVVQSVADFASISTAEARQRMRRVFSGENGQTCIAGTLSNAGRNHPADVVAFVRSCAKHSGVSEDELRMGGSVCQVTAIDEESMRSMRTLAPLSGIVALLVAGLCLRDVRLTIIALAISGYAAGISLALIFYLGYALNGVMIVLPTLAFVLTLSGAVHLLNYYRDERYADSEQPVERAMSAGWLPCTIAAATTSLGMASLAVSGLRPVREFGSFAAASLLFGLLLLLTVLPACLILWTGRNQDEGPSKASRTSSNGRLTNAVSQQIVQHHRWITLFSIVALVCLGFGLLSIRSSVRLDRMFRSDFRLIEDYRWIEDNIGPLSTIEIVLRFDREDQTTAKQQVDFVQNVHQACATVPEIGSVFSAATFLPRPPSGAGVRKALRRAVIREKIERSFDVFSQQGLAARDDEDNTLWRISARVPAMNSPDFEQLITDLKNKIAAIQSPTSDLVTYQFTGGYPLIDDSQKILLNDLAQSFALAFVFILPVMILTLRSMSTGLLAMLPNVAPIVIVFGAMGWLGTPIDIGIILTASVALGIAVDDTVHFLTWYQRAIASGSHVSEAVQVAFERCAPAMVQTTVICGLGVLVFSTSTFAPAGRFAVLLALLLVSALFGDLLMLPALLITRKPTNVQVAQRPLEQMEV